jgi:hypothetical protein
LKNNISSRSIYRTDLESKKIIIASNQLNRDNFLHIFFSEKIDFYYINILKSIIMAGWLDWIEDKIVCPFCRFKFTALFCEDGDTHREPVVITTLAGDSVNCPNCHKTIKNDDIKHKMNYFNSK